MYFQDFDYQYNLDSHIRELIKKSILNLNFHVMGRKDYFLFENPISVNYIVEDFTVIKHFFKTFLDKYLGDSFEQDRQLMILSPQEVVNFKSRFRLKDRKLPLFIVKINNLPTVDNTIAPPLQKTDSPYFMNNTQKKTKAMIVKQYTDILHQQDPKYTRELYRNQIFPTLYFDQVSSKQTVTMDVVQETNVELQHLFQNMNTRIFLNHLINKNLPVQLDTLIKKSNEKFNEIQDRFQYPVLYQINYDVYWRSYSNITQNEKNIYNYQKQTYEFEFTIYPITKFNLQGTLLNLDVDFGVNNIFITESDDEKDLVEWIKKLKIK